MVTLEQLVRQYGTNLLKAPVVELQLTLELYGRLVKITVPTGGLTEEFEVVG